MLRDVPGAGTWHYRLEVLDGDDKRRVHPAVAVRVGPGAEGRELFIPVAANAVRNARAAGGENAATSASVEARRPEDWRLRLWRLVMRVD